MSITCPPAAPAPLSSVESTGLAKPAARGLSSSQRWFYAAGLLCLAFPPVQWWPLAILSMAILSSLVAQPGPLGRRQYWLAWLAASLVWLWLLQGIRLAYWPLHAGWLALSLYLAIYLPLSIGLARELHHRWRWPLGVAWPLAWMAGELVRGYVITGFSGCLLGHTVAHQSWMIQGASHLGAYGVSMILVLAGTTLWSIWKRRWIETSIGLAVLAAWILGGLWSLAVNDRYHRERAALARVALLQENTPTIFEADPERNHNSWQSYRELTARTLAEHPDVDLVVWPESTFTRNEPWMQWDGSTQIPLELAAQGVGRQQLVETRAFLSEAAQQKIALLLDTRPSGAAPYWMLGCDLLQIDGTRYQRLNAALWISPEGKLVDHYAKQHLVMFGEYLPLGDWFPVIYRWIGMGAASRGAGWVRFELPSATIAPSICFENVVPHELGRGVQQLARQGAGPDMMINITNDGWFHGSSILDHHLANATLAAVENRRPMLVAGNTGLSAWIDGSGVRRAVSERLRAEAVLAQPRSDGRWGLWQSVTDLPHWAMTLTMVSMAVWSVRQRRGGRFHAPRNPTGAGTCDPEYSGRRKRTPGGASTRGSQ